MKIAFYFSGNGTRVRNILTSVNKSELSDLKLLICDNTLNEDLIVSELNYKFVSINYLDLSESKKDRNLLLSNRILELLIYNNIDYLFCWGDHLLKGDLLEKYRYRIINFHPSILPMFPGRFSIDKANEANSFLLGNTAHFIDDGIDTGPVILQSVSHSSLFTSESDYNKILDHQIIMFRQINLWLKENRLQINNHKVIVKNADYDHISFFPKLDL